MYLQKTKIIFACASVLLIATMLPCFNCNGEIVYGISSYDSVFKMDIEGDYQWKRIHHGKLMDISASGRGWVWGVNEKDAVFKCKKPCDGKWLDADGRIARISGGQDFVYGVNNKQAIFKMRIDGSGQWLDMDGRLDYITADHTEWLWGTHNGKVYRCAKPCNEGEGRWLRVPGYAKQISAGQTEVYALNGDQNSKHNSRVYARRADGTGNWRLVRGGSLSWIDASSPKYVLGVNKEGAVFKCRKPCHGNWQNLPGKLMAVSGVDYYNDAVYRTQPRSNRWRRRRRYYRYDQESDEDNSRMDADYVAERLAEAEMDNLLVYQTPTKPVETFMDMDHNDLEDYTIIATLIVVGVLLWTIQMRSAKRQGKREEEEVMKKRIDLTEPMLVDVAQK